MAAAATEGPTVAMSFANNFWGKDDAGVPPLLGRMHAAKQTCDELKSFYSARASIEDEYARKLMSLSRKALGSQETGALKNSLDTVRGEVESMARQHSSIAAQMKTELEEPLAAFAGGMKERRKIVQNTVEKLLKVKVQQTQAVNKTRDRYEQECLKIKGYLAQGHMVMGQEERKNKAKLEKTQINLVTSNTEYENAVKALEETTARWNREWKAAADKFQDLEEERLDFTKSSLWTFANIASTVCVSDDASCERVRLSLEKMEVEKDIITFIKEKGTGQEIPDAPKYINFCRGDVEDHESIKSVEDDNYSVAQFPRSINPAFRTSSPQPSMYESHHDPNSALAHDLSHTDQNTPGSREAGVAPQNVPAMVNPPAASRQGSLQQQPYDASQMGAAAVDPLTRGRAGSGLQQQPYDAAQMPPGLVDPFARSRQGSSGLQQQQYDYSPRSSATVNPLAHSRHGSGLQQQQYDLPQAEPTPANPLHGSWQGRYGGAQAEPTSSMPPPATRSRNGSQQQQYDSSQFATVPHDPYPLDGMTMLCRTDGMTSGMNSATSSNISARPSSRDDHSDYSNPTSLSSVEPPSGQVSPIKQQQQQPQTPSQSKPQAKPQPKPQPKADESPDKRVLKKRSGFFQNHSPFRRKSTKDVQAASNRNTWGPVSSQANGSGSKRPPVFQQPEQSVVPDRTTLSPEPIEANASLALNVGQNVFAVSNTDRQKKSQDQMPVDEQDPIALALAELKGVAGNKQSTARMSADHFHGISTPAPGQEGPQLSSSVPAPRMNSALAAGMRGTPPPSYDQQVSRLGVPAAAVTSKAMKETSRKYVEQTRDLFNANRAGSSYGSTPSRPSTRGNGDVPRTASPAPPRTASPRPTTKADLRQNNRSASPNPYASNQNIRTASPNPYAASKNVRAASPNPFGGSQNQQSASPSAYGSSSRQGQRSGSQASRTPTRGSDQGYYQAQSSPADIGRTASPSPYRAEYDRPSSSRADMAMQLANVGNNGGYGSQRGRNARPGTSQGGAMTFWDGRQTSVSGGRQRSKSVADPSRQYTRDGRAILHFARALYMYQAAIPEELGFSKGDYLAILRHQDDGWWEAEIHSGNGVGRSGLVPSNYLQPC